MATETENNGISPFGNPDFSVSPKFLKNFREILRRYSSPIFNYLTLIDLCQVRASSKMFYGIISEYYEIRLKIEIEDITNYQSINKEKTAEFMKNIDSQIPISHKNWLIFDLNTATLRIQSLLNRNIITQLRSIKNLGKISEDVFAPFCIIFGYNKSNNPKVKSDGWKKTAGIILNDSNFFLKSAKLDLENFEDNEILESFIILNSPNLEILKVKNYSPALATLIEWCQAVVSYHILIHPYTYRNDNSQIEVGSEVYDFAQIMEEKINKFYKFKRFLFKLGLVNIPLGDYVFNLQHSREAINNDINYGKYLNEDVIGNILSYIPINDSCKYLSVNKMFLKGYKNSLDKNCFEIMREIFTFKAQAYDRFIDILPIIYENNIFSKYFLMLDDILNSELKAKEEGINFVPFLSKEQLNDIKNLKIKSDLVESISKVLCTLLNEKPERKMSAKGEIKNQYLPTLKTLAINGSLLRRMRNLNKLDLTKKQINVLSEEMIKYYSVEKLNQIKRINRGIHQLLIWELYIFEYLKEYNPFNFIPINSIQNDNKLEQEEIEMLTFYNDMLNFLKYNLKAKYHFNTLTFGSMGKCPNYNFIILNDELNKYLTKSNINTDLIFDTMHPDHAKISTVYFESRDLIPLNAKPALFERIMVEIIATSNNNNNQINTSSSSKNNLGTIREESPNANNNVYSNYNNNNNKNNNNNTEKLRSVPPTSIRNNVFIDNKTNQNINTNNNLNTNYTTNNNNIVSNYLNDLPNNIIIKDILFYLDINSLPNFSLVNKKCNQCIKTHIFIRLFFLNKEKKLIEDERADLINNIDAKRESFFNEYEMTPPNKEHAFNLMSQITNDDILEIKSLYRKYNKTNEKIISPLVVLLEGKPRIEIKPNGTKEISYFKPAQKLILDKNFIKKMQNLELEIIPNNRFRQVEKLMQEQEFSNEKMKYFSPCLNHLIFWEMGVVEFHRVVRNYSLSYYDYNILNEDEIVFCQQMDNIILIYYKLLRYANKYCKKYENEATELMKTMNIEQPENEISSENEEDES